MIAGSRWVFVSSACWITCRSVAQAPRRIRAAKEEKEEIVRGVLMGLAPTSTLVRAHEGLQGNRPTLRGLAERGSRSRVDSGCDGDAPSADAAVPRLARRAPAQLRRRHGGVAHLVPAPLRLGGRAARGTGRARARRGRPERARARVARGVEARRVGGRGTGARISAMTFLPRKT